MPNRASRSGFAKKIDTVHWTYGSFSNLALGAGTAGQTVLSAQHLPETLLRTRGEICVWLDTTQAPPVSLSVGVGLILVPEGLSTTVTWSPISDGDAPWLWVDYFILAYEEMVTDQIAVQELIGVRRVIDSKAMRKVRNREFQFVVENATIGNPAAVNVAGQVRILSGS